MTKKLDENPIEEISGETVPVAKPLYLKVEAEGPIVSPEPPAHNNEGTEDA